MSITEKFLKDTITAYDDFIARAVAISALPGIGSKCVDADKMPRLRVTNNAVELVWMEYESDYYGGGDLTENSTELPLHALLASDSEFAAFRSEIEKEETGRANKLRAARLAVERDRQEAADRANYARLIAKYGAPK